MNVIPLFPGRFSGHIRGRMIAFLAYFGATLFVLSTSASPAIQYTETPEWKVPPTPPAVEIGFGSASLRQEFYPAGGVPVLYSIGTPTDAEQYYLELINRARANPLAEAHRLKATTDPDILSVYSHFNVNLDLMVSQFAAISAAPPLAMNPKLTSSARRHSADMGGNEFQGHTGSDGSSPGDRARDADYFYNLLGENVFAYSVSTEYGHAGFEVDWGATATGGTVGGMQDPPEHRISIHNPDFREIGVGVLELPGGGVVGPQVVTQALGSRPGLSPFITGVVYHDLNGSGFYDEGEGIGGVTVMVPGNGFYAVTANSGGYAVPVSGDGSYGVEFRGVELFEVTSAQVTGGDNVKVDLVVPYGPQISGPATIPVGATSYFAAGSVPLAEAMRWRWFKRVDFTYKEGAENGSLHFTAITSPGYELIQNEIKKSGNFAFHFAHPEPPEPQYLTSTRSVLATATSELRFQSRLRLATSDQVARAQVSADGGVTWDEVWSQAGDGTVGPTNFTLISRSLAVYAGNEILVRFVYDVANGGFFYGQTDNEVGFFLDDIGIVSAYELLEETVQELAADELLEFVPGSTGTFQLQVAAKTGGRWRPYGAFAEVSATFSSVSVSITRGPLSREVEPGEPFSLEVFANGTGPLTYQWYRNGTLLSGKTARVLSIVRADETTAGSYTVRVAGRGAATSNPATITLLPVELEGFAAWKELYFTPEEAADPAISGPLEDPGGRGISNLLRYAFDLRAPLAGSEGLPMAGRVAGEDGMSLVFRRLKDRGDLVYRVEVSTDLRSWEPGAVEYEVLEDHEDSQTVRARKVPAFSGRGFMRMKVELLE